MKRILAITVSLGLVAAFALVAMAAVPSYAGTWTLDKSKSGELPRFWQNADSIQLVVTQDAKQLVVTSKAGQAGDALAYNLDGSTSTADVGGRMPGKATLSAKVNANGSIELTSKRDVSFNGNATSFTTTETWELADGGKTLKVKRTSESPRGKQEYNLVFTKA